MSHAPSIAGLAGRAVWAAWSTSWQAAHPWRTGLTLLLPAVPMLVYLLGPWQWQPMAKALASLPLAIALFFVIWDPVATGLTLQNHPHSARLVPRQPIAMRVATVGAWIAATVVLAAVLRPGLSAAGASTASGVLTASLVTAIALWQRRWIPGLGVLMTLATFVVIWLYDRLPAVAQAQPPAWLSCLLVAATAWGVAKTPGCGDAAHSQSYQVLQAVRLASNEAGGEHDAFARVRGRMNLSQALGRAKHPIPGLRHDMDPATKLACLLFGRSALSAVGPSGLSTIVIAVPGALWIGLVRGGVDTSGGFIELAFTAVLAVSMLATKGRQLHIDVWKLRREQGLLQLLPNVGGRQALSAQLHRAWVRHLLAHVLPPFFALVAWAYWRGNSALLVAFLFGLPAALTSWPSRIDRLRPINSSLRDIGGLVLTVSAYWGLAQSSAVQLQIAAALGTAALVAVLIWKAREAAQSRHPLLIACVD